MTYAEWVKANPPPNLGACQLRWLDLITPAAWAHYDQASVHEPGKPLRARTALKSRLTIQQSATSIWPSLSTTTQD